MLFTVSLKKNSDFVRAYKNGRHYAGKFLILHVYINKPDEGPDTKSIGAKYLNALGITASKKVGKSVRRNRIKRLIKENYRQYELYIRPGNLFVFVVRVDRDGHMPDYYEIRREMRSLFLRAGVFDQQRWVSSQNGA